MVQDLSEQLSEATIKICHQEKPQFIRLVIIGQQLSSVAFSHFSQALCTLATTFKVTFK